MPGLQGKSSKQTNDGFKQVRSTLETHQGGFGYLGICF